MDYQYDYSTTADLSPEAAAGMWAIIMGSIAIFAVIGLVYYVYMALVLMALAKKTNTPNAWLAWVPIGNLYLTTQIAQVQWWSLLVFFLLWIPFVGTLGVLAVTIWWWWKICERMKKPGWWAILMLVPIANLIIPGILAWGKDK